MSSWSQQDISGDSWGKPHELPRLFELQIRLEPFNEIAIAVLDAIETPLMVFDANDVDALSDITDVSGTLVSDTHAKIREEVCDWLSLGCQIMRWDSPEDFGGAPNQAVAQYWQNGSDVLFPIGGTHMPAGPAMFSGRIIVKHDQLQDIPECPDKLKFVLAHELVHVFSILKVLVPAYKDWPLCWEKLLSTGTRCENARFLYQWQNSFLDDYGSENELAMVKQFWPSKADAWFKAFRG